MSLTAEGILRAGLDESLSGVPGYLSDWGSRHRPLEDDQRLAVGHYIAAVIAHEVTIEKLSIADAPDAAIAAWRRFRTAFDELTGPYSKGPRGDFPLAMRQI